MDSVTGMTVVQLDADLLDGDTDDVDERRVSGRDPQDAVLQLHSFVVRDDTRVADFLYQQPVTTYAAYNSWGSKSLYEHNSAGRTRLPARCAR
jgi:hypothetical protein